MKYLPALLVLACLWLTACGQTGPLYLPDAEQPAAEAPAGEDTSDQDL
jgi:predicted small lipoprotein YifL